MPWRICSTLILVLIYTFLPAQNRNVKVIAVTPEGESIELYKDSHALVVGVSDYTNGWPDLPNAVKDAREVTTELEKHGFRVEIVENPTRAQLAAAIDKFINQYGSGPQNRLLFYFAGHGHTLELSYGAQLGYIVPADAPLPDWNRGGFKSKAIDMQAFENYARRIEAKHTLFIFDSCFSGSIFAMTRAPSEAISYKTARPVRIFITAGDETEQVPDVSIFKQQFIEALRGEADVAPKDGYLTGTELGEFLYQKVSNYSRGSQHPQYGKIRDPKLDKGDFVFVMPGHGFVENIVLIPGGSFWMGSNNGDDDEKPLHEIYLADFFLGKYEVTVGDFRKFVNATSYRTEAEKRGGAWTYQGNGWLQKPDANWRDPYFSQSEDHPVVCITWDDAVAYCNWCSEQEGLTPVYTISSGVISYNLSANGYRLPTEAEWEYVARSGSKGYKYSWGNEAPHGKQVGNVADETGKRKFSSWVVFEGYTDGYIYTSPIGTFNHNAFGVYDITGNVREWCNDWYDSNYYQTSPQRNPRGPATGGRHVLRGGSWFGSPNTVRTANRAGFSIGLGYDDVGFRLARTP